MMVTNRRIILIKRPEGLPTWDDFRLETIEIPEPKGTYLLIKVLSISIDPAMRGWMKAGKSYLPPVGIGEIMRATGIGQVIRSTIKGYNKSDLLLGSFGLQEYAIIQNPKGLEKVNPSLGMPINAWINVLGISGLTAYFGFLKIGKPKPGDIVLISGAAGSTGSVVGQIAKLMNCRVIGIAGSDEKCNYLVNDLKYDAAINYKTSTSLSKQIKHLCPDGVDIFFDNVGGNVLDAALLNLAYGARVVLCGAISQYNAKQVKGPSNYMSLLVSRAQMKGFVIIDYAAEYNKARQRLATWIHQKLITYKMMQFDGLQSWIDAITSLFTGQNEGKCVLKLSSPNPTPAI